MSDGTQTALAAALAQHQAPEEPEQQDLLGLPPAKAKYGVEPVERTGKPGRPKGARNKRTAKTVEWLLSVHQDPRAVLLAIAEAAVTDLVTTLGCTPHEALQEKRLAAIGVLPYVAQRQPLAVDLTERKIVFLNINAGQVEAGAEPTDGIGLSARVIDGAVTLVTDETEGGDDSGA